VQNEIATENTSGTKRNNKTYRCTGKMMRRHD